MRVSLAWMESNGFDVHPYDLLLTYTLFHWDTLMKSFLKLFVVLSAVACLASQTMAQITVVSQAPAGDSGVFAAQDQMTTPDPLLSKAYDNFSLASDIVITGIEWSGMYAEPLPAARSDTDFIIEIWNVDGSNGLPDVSGGSVLQLVYEGGVVAGIGGGDLTVTPELGYTSAATNETPGGGEVYHYEANVPNVSLAAGSYWISILADQVFGNAAPVIDPEWQWHLAGAGDGFTSFDRGTMAPGTNQQGLLVPDKDLAFAIKAIPEPSTVLMAALGLAPIGLLRRKRS